MNENYEIRMNALGCLQLIGDEAIHKVDFIEMDQEEIQTLINILLSVIKSMFSKKEDAK